MNITRVQIKGPRSYQEDRFVHFTDSNGDIILGVFDGHGGYETSDKIAFNFVRIYHEVRDSSNYAESGEDILNKIFNKLDDLTKNDYSGSTASVVLVKANENKAFIATLGDSPVYIVHPSGFYNNPEHNVRTNIVEAHDAIKRGGYISGGYLFNSFNGDGIQMSRSFGDKALRPVLLQVPTIDSIDINVDSSIVVASDGFGDPAHGNNTGQFKNDVEDALRNGANAEDLLKLITKPQDNVTILVARN